jgi:hypothetical protein
LPWAFVVVARNTSSAVPNVPSAPAPVSTTLMPATPASPVSWVPLPLASNQTRSPRLPSSGSKVMRLGVRSRSWPLQLAVPPSSRTWKSKPTGPAPAAGGLYTSAPARMSCTKTSAPATRATPLSRSWPELGRVVSTTDLKLFPSTGSWKPKSDSLST